MKPADKLSRQQTAFEVILNAKDTEVEGYDQRENKKKLQYLCIQKMDTALASILIHSSLIINTQERINQTLNHCMDIVTGS